jgi:hypothetical protein
MRNQLLGLVLAILVPASGVAAVLHLTWVDNATNEDGSIIERRAGASGTFTELARVGPGVTLYNDAATLDGTGYCYQVRAFNAAGISPPSNPACGTAPATPTIPRLTLNLILKGPIMTVVATLTPGTTPMLTDAYIVLQAPDGSLYSVVDVNTAVPGVVAAARQFQPLPFFAEVVRYTFTGAEPAGVYRWIAALTQPGTVSVLGDLEEIPFEWRTAPL